MTQPVERPRESAAASPVILQAKGLKRHYGLVRAVDGVDLELRAGEVHALVGENGAGKSTVAKILAGTVSPNDGQVTVAGETVTLGSVSRAHRHGIVCAFQELAIVPDWTVAENLALVDVSMRRLFRSRRAVASAREILARLDLEHLDPAAPAGTLALAERQQLEIARALNADVSVLLLDEASSALTPPGVEWLFARIRELTARGVAVLYVSHRLSELAEIADRGTVLRDGRVVGQFERGQWTYSDLVTMMTGRQPDLTFPAKPPTCEATILEVHGLRNDLLDNIDLHVKAGEILGIGGLQGHGQTELLAALYGAVPASSDSWTIADRRVRRLTPNRAVQLGIGFVPEDRKNEGLALQQNVGENLLVPWLRSADVGGEILLRRERPWVSRVIQGLSIKTTGPRQAVGALSGGNQQKVVFGRWIDRDRKIVLLHDPTRGIDVGAKAELYNAICALAEAGTAIIWFSTEVEELVNLAHRVVVLYRGRAADELTGERLTAENVVGASLGLETSR